MQHLNAQKCLFFERQYETIQKDIYSSFYRTVFQHLLARLPQHCVTCDNIPVLVRATLALRVMGDAEKGEDPALVRKFVHEVGVRGLGAQLINAVVRSLSCWVVGYDANSRDLRLGGWFTVRCP